MSNPQDAEGWLFAAAKLRYQNAVEDGLPNVRYRPTLKRDGDQWCALYGDNLQEGVAGFGKSPELAMMAFDAAWWKVIE